MQGQKISPLVFVVDGDYGTVRAVDGFMKPAGFRPASAGDVAGALQGIQEQHLDLILLDVNLPGGSGLEGCRSLNAEATAFTPYRGF